MNLTEAISLLEEARAAWQSAVEGVEQAMAMADQAASTYSQVEQAFLEYERQSKADNTEQPTPV